MKKMKKRPYPLTVTKRSVKKKMTKARKKMAEIRKCREMKGARKCREMQEARKCREMQEAIEDAQREIQQRMKISPALSYLEQIRMHFGSKSHIYDDFLDLLREFKSKM